MEMPAPTAAHKLLHTLVGNWIGEEKMHPSPWSPAGAVAMGRVRNRAALGDLAVIQEYEQEMDGAVQFRGHGIFTFDGKANQHVLYWFDSMIQSPPNVFVGGFRGQSLVLVHTGEQGQVRASWELMHADNYSYRMEVSGDGSTWQPMMEAIYRRQK